MKSFQVDTLNIPEIKKLLVGSYEKKFGRCYFTSCDNIENSYLQFWVNGNADGFRQPHVTHNREAYSNYEVVSIEEAIKRLVAKRSKTIKLNGEYSAIITEGQDQIKVGCQTGPITAVKELHAAILELEKPTP